MSAPDRIYLQWIEEASYPYVHEGVTWCADMIEDTDVEYVRADKAAAEIEALKLSAKNMGLDADCAREDRDRVQAERDHWKANHDHQVSAARFLVERGDIPLERVRAFKAMQALRTVVQNTMALGLITEDQPLLLARAKAALNQGTDNGAPR